MFVIYKVIFKDNEVKRERVQEFKTLDEAGDFIKDHADGPDLYTVVME